VQLVYDPRRLAGVTTTRFGVARVLQVSPEKFWWQVPSLAKRRWRTPRGCCRQVRQQSPPKLETSLAGPLGVLSAGPATATTEVGDIDGSPVGGAVGRSGNGHHHSWRRRWRPRGGCCRQVRQRPPSELETSMVGPLGVLSAGPTAATIAVGDVDGEPPGECCRYVQ
jgi:hypothetical protein